MASTAFSFDDMVPSPRVRLDIDPADLLAGTVTVNILQISKWGEVVVRNGRDRAVSGGIVLEDYEIPPGVDVVYRVEQFDAAGVSLGFALSLSARVDLPSFDKVIVQDPLAPTNAVLLMADFVFANEFRRTRPRQVYQAGGRTFAMSGIVSAFQKVNLRVYTTTDDERDMLDTILEQSTILVRTMPRNRMPGAFYASVADLPMIPVDARQGGHWDLWDLVGDQVTRPELEVLVGVYTYDLFKAYLDELHAPAPATYNDAAALWATYLDAMRNPPSI